MTDFDVLIVGSGPSGVQAAFQCAQNGVRTALIDIGFIGTAQVVPEKSFIEIRSTNKEQRKIFLGDQPDKPYESQSRAGIHLSPGRSHMIKNMETLFPLESSGFFALQATGVGGLGIGWGANAFAFEDAELKEIGIEPKELRPYYAEVSKDIGISGVETDDLSPTVSAGLHLQSPLLIDTNAQSILTEFKKHRQTLTAKGFRLGQSVLAVLSEPLKGREANKLHDMDYWSDSGKSVYRPLYTLEEIQRTPILGKHFTHLSQRKALSFREEGSGVAVRVLNLTSNTEEEIHTKKLILAAGAINSARIVLQSIGDYEHKTPLLCNHNVWIAAIHLPMLGKPAQDERHSLSQLTALLNIPESRVGEQSDYMLSQIYSYRSLMMTRLLTALPLPPRLGLYFLRLILTSLTMINVHFSDRPSVNRFLQLTRTPRGDTLSIESTFSNEEEALFKKYERKFKRILLTLKTIPLKTERPTHGASIHYAGTLPYSSEPARATCDKRGKLHETKHVYVADGSTWKFLPSKGLTLTLMANARRIAQCVVDDLHV